MKAVQRFVALLVATPLLATPLAAQIHDVPGPASDTAFTLIGTVVDAETGAPVEGAVVRVEGHDRAVMSDADGRFAFPDVIPGAATFGVEQLGYQIAIRTRAVRPGSVVRIHLKPDPLVLETLPVVVDRLRRARYSKGISVKVLHRSDFSPQSRQLLSAVRSRGGLWMTPCRGGDRYWCVYRRGRVVSPAVYIDDRYAFMGLDELEFLWTSDIYVVEIYRFGAAVRVYTDQYMQRKARQLSVLPGPIP